MHAASAGSDTARSNRAGRRADETVDDLRAEAFSPDEESITTDDRDSKGTSEDYEGGFHGIMENAARRTVGEQARSADKRTWDEVELPGADSSVAGSSSPEVPPNYDVNESWRQLTNIDSE